jgi:hypothetical protein
MPSSEFQPLHSRQPTNTPQKAAGMKPSHSGTHDSAPSFPRPVRSGKMSSDGFYAEDTSSCGSPDTASSSRELKVDAIAERKVGDVSVAHAPPRRSTTPTRSTSSTFGPESYATTPSTVFVKLEPQDSALPSSDCSTPTSSDPKPITSGSKWIHPVPPECLKSYPDWSKNRKF